MKHLARTIFLLSALGLLNAGAGIAQVTPETTRVKPVGPLATPEVDPKSWKEFSSTDGRFAAQFPGTPRATTETVNVSGGQLEVRIFQLQTFAEYSVIYSDYPAAPSSAEAAARILDTIVKGAARAVNATLLSETEISIEGHPGRLLKERLPGGSILRAKFYLVGRRLYQVAITTPPEEGASAATVKFADDTAWKFLGSFKLKPFVAETR